MALATVGCAPPGPQAPAAATEAMRSVMKLGAPLNLDLNVLRSGSGPGPRLILVHGTPGSATGWADYLVSPPPGVEVIALDRPGFGDSGPAGALTSLAAQAAAVAALLPEDGRPVVLLGHSLGGPVVARVAAEHPDRVTGLVLLAASLDPALEKIHPLQVLGASAVVRPMLPRAIRNANAELMALEDELRALAPMLSAIRAHVVIVHGTRDDLVPVENVAYIQTRLQGARCVDTVLLEGRNHFLPWNSAAEVRAAVAQSLRADCP